MPNPKINKTQIFKFKNQKLKENRNQNFNQKDQIPEKQRDLM